MSGKRCHDNVSHNGVSESDDQRSSRPRHDFQNNINHLHTLIDNHLQMIPANSLNMIERLHEIIDEQNEWLGAPVNNGAQIGRGPSNMTPQITIRQLQIWVSRGFYRQINKRRRRARR